MENDFRSKVETGEISPQQLMTYRDKNDVAKIVVSNWLESLHLVENFTSFINLKTEDNSLLFDVTVEHSKKNSRWKDKNTFPFPMCNVPSENVKLGYALSPYNTFIIKLSNNLESGYIAFGKDIVTKAIPDVLVIAKHGDTETPRYFHKLDRKEVLFFNVNNTDKNNVIKFIENRVINPSVVVKSR